LEEIRNLVNEKGMKPTIDNVYALSDKGVQDAFDRIRSRRAIGKIVIDFNLKTE
jgi:NADPH:quinone reductase-like Zn-dependent oxidoreductase